jgi:hypothetical protein
MEPKTTTKDYSRVENTTNKGRSRVECIQSSNFKHVPFEQIDYTIYKASTNTVAFTTTEDRMPLIIMDRSFESTIPRRPPYQHKYHCALGRKRKQG